MRLRLRVLNSMSWCGVGCFILLFVCVVFRLVLF